MPWYPYKPVRGGHLPAVDVQLIRNSGNCSRIPFLVDSGAAWSIVPKHYVLRIIGDLQDVPDQDIDAQDANGKPLRGIAVDFDVRIVHSEGLLVAKERVWVCSTPAYWALLGQTWFEKVAVRFHNFPEAAKGRRFCLYRL